jgi:hypothetical protein
LPERNLTQQTASIIHGTKSHRRSTRFDKENERVQKIEAAERTAYEHAVSKVQERLLLYAQLKNTLQPQDAQNWKQELADYENLIPAGIAAVQAQQAGQKYDQTNLQ